MFSNFARLLGGDPHKREIQKLSAIVEEINGLEETYEQLSDEALKAKTAEFRERLEKGETLDDLLPEAFAAVRAASKRNIGQRQYDVQLIGGITLHQGKIAEMRTGEGKTLTATLAVYLNALTRRGVHLVTVNDYLARRDARWMAPIYQALGMSVGVLQMSANEGGRFGFLVDLEKTSPHEDQNQLRKVHRKECYTADVTYGTNSEFGFDYLRDNLTMSMDDRVQRKHYFAIIDEVDNILIDEARTPLIISGPAQDEGEWYVRMAQVVRQLNPEDYEINEKDRAVSLTEAGEAHVEEILDMPLRDPDRPEDITPEQARVLGYLEQGLRAQYLYRRNKDYIVQGGKVIIVDEFTGRLMPGRRWSEGLHQAVEAKEGVKVEPENITYATITLQNYFRMYEKLSGMTGTALTEAEEFSKIYKLEVLAIPTNLEFVAMQKGSPLKTVEAKDEQGYKYMYYAQENDTRNRPIFWKRKDYPDVVYRTSEAKLRAISQEILSYYVIGRPQLVGTTSVEHSELLSGRLEAEPIRRLAQTLLVRDAWMRKNNTDMITSKVEELLPLNKPLEQLNVGEIRPLARDLGISMNMEDDENLDRLVEVLGVPAENKERLRKVMQGGVPHKVLNARKHDEESMIIAGAGAFGAVTIATNMAGRGVDIKLGGELSEDILRDVNRVLGKSEDDPYDMRNEERLELLKKMPEEEYGIYEESVRAFIQYMDDARRVRELGGLHVIGSERHEARRIDNQLRGRAARQGDPGSSRFYLSLEDDLMRLFGGAQVESMWKRIFSDESQPLEMNLIGRVVEQSQERVEGTNFDVRKHLLEYDDVLNSQRTRIYSQRDMVFEKEDLSEDVLEMLGIELERRIKEGLKDPEGPWKLLAYLDQVQPPFQYESIVCPSFTFRLLIEAVEDKLPQGETTDQDVENALLDVARQAMEAEREHILNTARNLLEHTEDNYHQQVQERSETLDTFFESLEDSESEYAQMRPQDLLMQLSELVRVPLKLNPEQMRALPEGDREVAEALEQQINNYLGTINLNRVIGALERRLDESLNLKGSIAQNADWTEAAGQVMDATASVLDQRLERLLGEEGQIARDLDSALTKIGDEEIGPKQWMDLLTLMTQGSKIAFDARTHRRSTQAVTRLSYVYLTARWLQDKTPQQVTTKVQNHMLEALQQLETARGMAEWDWLARSAATLQQLDERRRNKLAEAFGVEEFEDLAQRPLSEFDEEQRKLAEQVLGHFLQNQVYRDLLLQVISEQWVDYLTSVEALRVTIGLEAYAQRDPLVQYKSKATTMFQQLLADVRMGVIAHIFTYRVSNAASANVEREKPEAAKVTAPNGGDQASQPQSQQPDQPPQQTAPAAQRNFPSPGGPGSGQGAGGKNKKKRKRH